MTFNDSISAISFLNNTDLIGFENSFYLSKLCSSLLKSKDHEKIARDIIIRVLDVWDKVDDSTKPIWNDLIEAAGLYPYVDSEFLSRSAQIRYEYHKSPFIQDIYLHSEQQELSIALQNKNSIVVSAPTSFGKSLLIEELIASCLYKQIVIIQPTLALLDETRKKLLRYREDYKIIVSTNQEPDLIKCNIFLFTGERVVEYQHFPNVDFFIIDEFYKLSLDRDDDRAIALNQALYRLLKLTQRFYLLGPMIQNIPNSFKEKFNLKWFSTEFATVAVDEINLELTEKLKSTEKEEKKKHRLFELLISDRAQTLIYCSSPSRATYLALEFISHLKNTSQTKANPFNSDQEVENNEIIIEWIRQNVNSSWSLSEALKYGIAFHHGAIPRHLGSSIIDAFNNGSIRWLFCTSTLIEGVNTSAKNVILFDKKRN
ncbi:DEAD/DEAH box helicase [Adhaeribacter swui]|uniref:DEAD/DEAH box helicase n=1 Tax=Adhaeribacter swui TaxID=2086471 RepID=A0A7G7G9U5_9BACT|nr:DEAD/DEAH box helicase [Adhaeribacter swui]QNF33929.1 DEAD/DEAH box helicase [Adhaeribacter swui]